MNNVSLTPFRHAVVDQFLPRRDGHQASMAFPGLKDAPWKIHSHSHVKNKWACNVLSKLPAPILRVMEFLNSPEVVAHVSSLLRIPGLVPDDEFEGGGCHMITRGGFLHAHADFNLHPRKPWLRVANLLLYLNEDWKPEDGGELELHDERGCVRRIEPLYNRAVIFGTDEKAIHGHPDPLRAEVRRSIAAYYYLPLTGPLPPRHSTLYREYLPAVTLITPTRDRPEAFALCERWISRQTVRPFQWIVVDDGDVPINPTMGQDYVRREPSEKVNTLPENLLAALPLVKGRVVVMVEDDEWYAPDYVERMARGLAQAPLGGERHARYYHVGDRAWREKLPNQRQHCSLCRTGFSADLIPRMVEACEVSKLLGDPFVDMRFWGVNPGCSGPVPSSVNVSIDRPLSIGIKGLPGRGGLGSAHRPGSLPKKDPTGAKLVEWIGEDAQFYLGSNNAR